MSLIQLWKQAVYFLLFRDILFSKKMFVNGEENEKSLARVESRPR